MKKTILAMTATAAFAVSGAASAAVIDLFNDPATQLVTTITALGGSNPAFSEVAGSGVIGGYRDLYVETLSGGSPSKGTTLAAGGGELNFANSPSVAGIGRVQWDGMDGSSALAVGGLGGIDVTLGCGSLACDRFVTAVDFADFGFPYQITAYDMEGDWSTLTSDTLFPVNSPSVAEYLFSWFNLADGFQFQGGLPFFITSGDGVASNGLVDFDNLGALEFVINWDGSAVGPLAVDLEIGNITTQVPAPASMALLGLGGLLAGFSMRRRKA